MFGFIKKLIFVVATFFNLSHVNPLECVSINNQECKARTKIIDINSNEPMFYPYSIKVNNVAEVVTLLMTHMLNCVFQISLKT